MIYFDNAATTFPKPESVYEAVNQCLRNYCANPGRGGHKLSLQSSRVIYDTREKLANLFKVDRSERIIFTANATDSINLALKGLLKEGDHVITTSMEHNSVIRPLKALESAGVESTIVNCNMQGEVELDCVEKAIRSNTKLIITTHASNVVGTLLPIKEIGTLARKKEILYMVDAAQTAGVYEINVVEEKIDILVGTGHKSLYGIQGVGFLYVGERASLSEVKQGGTGSKSELLVQPDLWPDKFESGTHNTPGIAALGAGIDFISSVGINNIRVHEEGLAAYFLKALETIDSIKIYGTKDASKQAPVISLNVGDLGSTEISYMLDSEYDIATRPALHCSPLAHITTNSLEQGTVRFSFGFFNTKDEIDKAVYALSSIVREI